MPNSSPRLMFDLARMMIKQAKMLRDVGLVREARDLARHAMAVDEAGWNSRALQTVPVRRSPARR